MRNIINKIPGITAVLSFLFLSGIVFSSCKKDAIDSPKEFYVYTGPGTAAYNVISGGSATVIGHTLIASANVAFPVLLSRPFDKDVEVTAAIDTAWVKSYDSAYSPTTASPTLPSKSFTLSNEGTVIIKAGQTASADSMRIMLGDFWKLKAGTNTYIVPVVITEVSKGLPVSNTRQVMYVKYVITTIATSIASTTGTNIIDIWLDSANGVNSGTNKAYIVGGINQGLLKDLSIAVKNDDAMVDKFNIENGTNYKAFPAGSFLLTKDKVLIKQKTIKSVDSIEVKLPDLNLFVAGQKYLLPVEIIDDTDPSDPISDPSKNIVYIRASVLVNNVDPSNSGLTGTNINRAKWIVTTRGNYGSNSGNKVLDGDNATAWDSNPGLPVWLKLDMGETQKVNGFAIVPNYLYTTDNFLNMEVYSSKNGNVWELEGRYKGTATTGSATNPDIKTVKFITAVSAQYFKFSITKANGNYGGMGELNAKQ